LTRPALLDRPGSAQVVTAHGAHQAFENAVAIAGNQCAAIFTKISIGGRNARQCTARRPTHGAKLTELRQQTFHAIENRLVQGDINHLAQTTFLLFMQGH
jgi:hypothetical protein